jgi:hypothetical protein
MKPSALAEVERAKRDREKLASVTTLRRAHPRGRAPRPDLEPRPPTAIRKGGVALDGRSRLNCSAGYARVRGYCSRLAHDHEGG